MKRSGKLTKFICSALLLGTAAALGCPGASVSGISPRILANEAASTPQPAGGTKATDGSDTTGSEPPGTAENENSTGNVAAPRETAFHPETYPALDIPFVRLYENNGSGRSVILQDASGAGEGIALPACSFNRIGYVFRGWGLEDSGTSAAYEDQDTVDDPSVTRLFALWEPQMYLIRFDGNGADHGEMDVQAANYDTPAVLEDMGFGKKGMRFAGWRLPGGNIVPNGGTVTNLDHGDTFSEKLFTADINHPKNEKYSFKSTQGSVVYEENGHLYLLAASILNDGAYNRGDLSHYETVLNKYDLDTGEAVKRVRNLAFDHGNSICYNPDNGHFYIAEGGQCEGYPSGIMELDKDLNEVREYSIPGLTHIWAIAYNDHKYYVIGRNNGSRNSFCTLNENMQTLSVTPADDYYTNFSSQGIAADDKFIYAVSAGFTTYEWHSKQRINVFTHDGDYVGVWSLDIEDEAEDLSVIGGIAYITTNDKDEAGKHWTSLYRTKLPSVTLTAQWEKAGK